jgi:hypothetical protein
MKVFTQHRLGIGFAVILLAMLGGVGCATVDSATTPDASPQAPEASLQWTAASPDGLAVFSLALSRPWDGAECRMVTFNTGFVNADGLAGLQSSLTTDIGVGDAPLIANGERYRCTATLVKVGAWKDVRAKTDVSLLVTAVAK